MKWFKRALVIGMIATIAISGNYTALGVYSAANSNVDATTSATQSAPPVQPTPTPTPPPSNTVKTTPPVSTVSQAATLGTLYIDGVKDFRIVINDKLTVTSVYNYSQPKSTYASSKGKSLKSVLTTLKKEIITTKGTASLITVAFGTDFNNEKQKKEISTLVAGVFKDQPMALINLSKTHNATVKKSGPNHLLDLALATSADFSYKKAGTTTFSSYAVLTGSNNTQTNSKPQEKTDDDDDDDEKGENDSRDDD